MWVCEVLRDEPTGGFVMEVNGEEINSIKQWPIAVSFILFFLPIWIMGAYILRVMIEGLWKNHREVCGKPDEHNFKSSNKDKQETSKR
jgi:hypothetical protein